MNNIFYEMIFKRKSFHIFRNVGNAYDEIMKQVDNYKQYAD